MRVPWTEGLLLAFQYVHAISGVFFYLSSAANPVLYSLMSTRSDALSSGRPCAQGPSAGQLSLFTFSASAG